MKKLLKILCYIILLLIGAYAILVFVNVKPEVLTVEVKAQYTYSDKFQLFYAFEDNPSFSEGNSINYKFSGKAETQDIVFKIPLKGKKLAGLRFDISSNSGQKPISISSIAFKAAGNQINLNEGMQNVFKTNEYVQFKDQELIMTRVNGQYDPFLIYTGDYKAINGLSGVSHFFNTNIFTLVLIFIYGAVLYYFFSNFSYNIPKIHRLHTALISIFIIVITIPLLLNALKKDETVSIIENRKLKEKPELHFSKRFFIGYEDYYNDHFVYRDKLINAHTRLKVNLFRSSPFPDKVLFGRNKFLFTNIPEAFESYSHSNLLSKDELGNVIQTFVGRRQMLKEKDIKYYFGFFPNKHTIYPEYLPFAMKSQIRGTISLADQLKTALAKENFVFFDPTEVLLTNKKEALLYLKLDTHWNNAGAYIAYRSFFSTYKDLDLQPLSKDNFSLRYVTQTFGDLTKLMGTEEIYGYIEKRPLFELKNKDYAFKTKDVSELPPLAVHTVNENREKKQKVLFFGDSFSNNLIQFFSLHFYDVVYLRDSYNQEMVDKINPDIVIEIPVERLLYKHFPKFN